jgi:hypothetical protein
MNPKVLAAGVFAAACVTAAAGGAYLALRQNAQQPPARVVEAPAQLAPAARPVAETEAVVGGTSDSKAGAPARTSPQPEAGPASSPSPVREATVGDGAARPPQSAARQDTSRRPAPASRPSAAAQPAPQRPTGPAAQPAMPASPATDRPAPEKEPVAQVPPPADPAPEPVRAPEPQAPQFDEVVVPASAVIGLQIDTPISSERTRIEDRVDARVTRDVSAAGRVAIPAGSRVIGSVTLVEKGGKVKERARLGVRFHTLVLADGREMPLRTEAIFREGESPAADSARKIGGAAIGGAILGAIMGGGKGAAIGSAAGAAGGSAAVMAGDRNAATLPAGTIVTVRLAAPATLEVERR